MEPDDLLCSRNARSRTPLVGRAQWKINQPPSLKGITSELGGIICSLVRRAHSRINQATLENEVGDWEDVRSCGLIQASHGDGS